MSGPREIIVERHYIVDRNAQASALKLLMNHTSKEKAAGANGGGYAEKEIKDASRRKLSLPASS